MRNTVGIVMISFGEAFADYLFECLWWHSKTWPGARLHLWHDLAPEKKHDLSKFDLDLTEEFVVASRNSVWTQRIQLLSKSPFDYTLYLDADVLSNPMSNAPNLNDLAEGSLRSADFMALSGMSLNHQWESEEFPSLFLQPNAGVMLYRTSACAQLFHHWEEHYSRDHAHDQPALRAAILTSGVRFLPLPASWNFQGWGVLESPPNLVHLTMGYRKKWLLDHHFIESLLGRLSGGDFPKFMANFADSYPLPSAWQNGPSLRFWLRGIRLWFWTRAKLLIRSFRD